jgi:hypothetical protein
MRSDRAALSSEPAIIAEGVSRLRRGLPKMSAVAMLACGLTTAKA